MIKNVIVVDEQGNEYGATYPKRAKGLVKNGRARFIDENKICIACPPDIFWEDNQMENNINSNTLTAKEIFDQIVKLQFQLTEHGLSSLMNLSTAVDSVCGENNENKDDIASQIEPICAVFAQREETLKSMLDLYRKMYEDCRADKSRKEEKVKDLFESMVRDFASADFSDSAQFENYPEVAEKFSQVVDILYGE